MVARRPPPMSKILLPLLILGSKRSCNGIQVLKSLLKLEDEGRGLSGARLDDNRTVEMSDVTFCIRFNFKILGRWEQRSQLMHIEDWRPEPMDPPFQLLNFGANYPFSFFGFGYPKKEGSYKTYVLRDPDYEGFEVWATNRWSHVCFSYERENGYLRIVKDGKMMNINFADEGMTEVHIPNDFLSKIYLGRCSFDYKNSCSSPEGQITDFNIWDRPLTAEEAIEFTTCKKLIKGNIVSWDQAKFEILNMTSVEVPMDSVCVPPRPGHVVMPMKRNFTSHTTICNKLKGVPSVIDSADTQQKMNKEMIKHANCGNSKDLDSGRYWAGYYDEPKEGSFENVNTGQVLKKGMYQSWYLGEPNGDTLENCAMVWIARNAWNDVSCSHKYCSFCEFEKAPDIMIRGLCEETKFDFQYSWTRQLINGRHSFRGYTGTMLQFQPETNQWTLRPHKSEGILGVTNSTEYPFGRNVWQITGDPCYEEKVNYVTLNINACNNSEYNCNDGYCININKRCDGKVDCPDKSDEIGCEILTTDRSYLKDVPPPSDGELTNVMVSLDLLEILEISEVGNIITMQIDLRLSWTDRRLTLLNLKTEKNLNTLIPAFRQKIWIPHVVFYNTQKKVDSLNDDKAFATISRLGSFKQSPRTQLDNAYFFKGSENPLTISRVYDAEFLCEFDMAKFPFDTQQCSIVMVMKGNTGQFIHMVAGDLQYLGPIDLTQYFIKKVEMGNHTVGNDIQALRVNIVFGRRILATILTTYLPTALLCMVCFSTNYFKAFFFEAIVTVNLTSLLVLTTLFISVFNSLPTTAYVKMIDVWLIFNLFIPFCEVLLHTFIDSLREEEFRDVNHHGRSIQVQPTSPNANDNPNSMEPRVTMSKKADDAARRKMLSVSVVRDASLIARNEASEVEARRRHYDALGARRGRTGILLAAHRAASVGLPVAFFAFALVYFCVALSHYHSDHGF